MERSARPAPRLPRRALVLGGAALAAAALGCRGKARPAPPARSPRVGYLASVTNAENEAAFLDGLRSLGRAPGAAVLVERRSAEGREERLEALAAELAALGVAVLVAAGPQALAAALRATAGVPIVMVAGPGEALGDGTVASLARPGGRVTGTLVAPIAAYGARIPGLIRETLPAARHVAVLWPSVPAAYAAAAADVGLRLSPTPFAAPDELEDALGALPADVDALWAVVEQPVWLLHAPRVVARAAAAGRPVYASFRHWAAAGALLAYGPDLRAAFRTAARHVDRILAGADPAELAVETPDIVAFVLNLGAARRLDLTIPPAVLARATEVIP